MSLLLFLKSTFAFLKCFCFIDPFLAMAELKIVFLLIWLDEKLQIFLRCKSIKIQKVTQYSLFMKF